MPTLSNDSFGKLLANLCRPKSRICTTGFGPLRQAPSFADASEDKQDKQQNATQCTNKSSYNNGIENSLAKNTWIWTAGFGVMKNIEYNLSGKSKHNSGLFHPSKRGKMNPKAKKSRFRQGFSLVDVMTSITILLVAVIGTSHFRYYAALDARRADMRIAAARIGLLLCESWRGVNGAETYDPIAHLGSDLTIESVEEGPVVPADFTLLGKYRITAEGIEYQAVLSWKDVSTGLRAQNVIVRWYPHGSGSSHAKLFKLTTYTPR